tara:strand:+ start:3528 stop:4037 length:510 start_codon:yes stop_codon:yes gene_type:complete
MRYKIIDEEVVESLIKFLDEIQFGTAEHGMKRSTVEIVNMCSYFISELLDAEEVIDNDGEDERKRIDDIIEFQMGEMPDEDYEKMIQQFDSFFKNFKIEYHKSKAEKKSKDDKSKLKHFKNELKKDVDLTNEEKFELYYDEYLLNKQKQNSVGFNKILNDIGLTLNNRK